jgi:hypothetical protein
VTLTLRAVGRCRLTFRYMASGCNPSTNSMASRDCTAARTLAQTVHLMILEPARTLLHRFGAFGSKQGWLPATKPDPWHRSPAFMGTDADRRGDEVGAGALLDEPRIFMDGLSDEAGAAAPLAMAIKQLGGPVATEVVQLEEYVHTTLWTPEGGERRHYVQGRDYSVRGSMAFWSDELQANPEKARAHAHAPIDILEYTHRHAPTGMHMHLYPEKARAAAPALTAECLKCWASCPKKTNCCNWMVCTPTP